MPRFFIHAHGPKRSIPDRDGIVLDDVPTARALALLAVVETLDDRDDVRDFLDWRFEVTDDVGQTVLTIPFLDCAFAWGILRTSRRGRTLRDGPQGRPGARRSSP